MSNPDSAPKAPRVETSLSLTEIGLKGIGITPVIDHVFKLLIPKDTTNIEIVELVSWDGISLRRFDVNDDRRAKATIKGEGKVSLKKVSGAVDIVSELADAGGKIFLGGSILQAKKIFEMGLGKSGLAGHNGKAEFKASLKVGGREIGEAVYTITKYHSLDQEKSRGLPEFLHTAEQTPGGIWKKPALVTTSRLNLDLDSLEPNKDGMVRLTMRENFRIDDISPDHARDVVITAVYNLKVREAENITFETINAQGINLGPFTFEKIISDTQRL